MLREKLRILCITLATRGTKCPKILALSTILIHMYGPGKEYGTHVFPFSIFSSESASI